MTQPLDRFACWLPTETVRPECFAPLAEVPPGATCRTCCFQWLDRKTLNGADSTFNARRAICAQRNWYALTNEKPNKNGAIGLQRLTPQGREYTRRYDILSAATSDHHKLLAHELAQSGEKH